jgi:hypothetical protein
VTSDAGQPRYVITPEQRDEAERRGALVAADLERPEWGRFQGFDPRFPVGVSLPGLLSFRFDRHDPATLQVELTGERCDLYVGRLDLRLAVAEARFEGPWAREVVDGRRDEVWFTEQRERQARRTFGRRGLFGGYRIQRHRLTVAGFRASRLVRRDGSVRVFFLDHERTLWNVGSDSLRGQALADVLSTFTLF